MITSEDGACDNFGEVKVIDRARRMLPISAVLEIRVSAF